ncbi:YncE family protein [Bradyrhizobium sp.]|uniref:YncE family protein n=1 Tax=Bradyrhizobium sp. TaxID=376 RepID=UPI000A801329|nr:YncE family protein [Bradyrhizobium sp.]
MRSSTAASALITTAFVALAGSAAHAEFAVSANDGKMVLEDGVAKVRKNPLPDSVAIIELSGGAPRMVAELPVPASVVGPPSSVAIASDESFALVTGAMKIDPADPTKAIPDDRLTVIDLKSSPPKVLATLQAGAGAAGVSINRSGTLALVANRSEGSVSVFTISGNTLTAAGKVALGDAKSGPSHPMFSRDGTAALVTRDGDSRIAVLSVDGAKVEYTKRDLTAGVRPYQIDSTGNGDVAIVANIGTGSGDADSISLIDMRAKPVRVVTTVSVAQTPEGLKMSPDGAYVAVTAMNGSNKPKASPFYNDYGLLQIFRISGTSLTPVTKARIGHWCQGVAWSKDSKILLAQCMVENEIVPFTFDGKTLTRGTPIAMKASPAGIRTAEP